MSNLHSTLNFSPQFLLTFQIYRIRDLPTPTVVGSTLSGVLHVQTPPLSRLQSKICMIQTLRINCRFIFAVRTWSPGVSLGKRRILSVLILFESMKIQDCRVFVIQVFSFPEISDYMILLYYLTLDCPYLFSPLNTFLLQFVNFSYR